MLDIIHGQTKNIEVANALSIILKSINITGSLYIGYPVLATADEKITVDALLVSQEHSAIIFSFHQSVPLKEDSGSWDNLREEQDRLYSAIEANLKRHDTLRDGRRLNVKITTITLFPNIPFSLEENDEYVFTDLDGIKTRLDGIPPLDERIMAALQAALQRVTTIRPRKKRETATTPNSRGAIIKGIEQGIANLDQWQKMAAIESPEGPQRIRGLAGSGKTVVLALKAAYLHAQHPDWIIAVTFFSRSLYQQIQDLIRRFSFEHQGDEPNWDNLRLRHAWGSSDRDGIYTEIAKHCGLPSRDYLYASSSYGRRDAFNGICGEVLSTTSEKAPEPIYDAILIDEAQDLPISFFHLAYRFVREPKRIIWAYDELQKLSEVGMPSLAELFGTDEKGAPNIYLSNTENSPHQDIILPVCYRNPPWALTTAHGLGLGTQREEGLVQHFDDPSFWTEIGYQVVDGELVEGEKITLERKPNSYPDYFKEFFVPTDVVNSHTFNDRQQQAEWVAENISKDLSEGQLEHEDILIILPSAYTAKKEAPVIMSALDRRGINAHLAGVTTSPDQIFIHGSVAIANIYRSKGNEAAMVYIINAHQCVSSSEQITFRNILFTAITRSRAWVRICGIGKNMGLLKKEVDDIISNNYRLSFRIPKSEELEQIRQIHRELTAGERGKRNQATKGLKVFIEAFERGDITLDNLPLELRTAIAKYFSRPNLLNRNEDTEWDTNRDT